MALTYANLKTQVIELAHLDSTDQAAMVGRWINKRYEEWAGREQWPELIKAGHSGGFITTFAEYDTGTVDVTEGSTTVTGTDTAWLTGAILAGMKFKVDGFEEIYDISADASSETSLTLSSAYNGDDASTQGYKIFKDEYTLATDCREPLIFYRDDCPIEVVGCGIRSFRRASALWRASGNDPYIYTLSGLSSGNWILTIDPPPDDNLLINYDYIQEITELSDDDDEPVMRNHMRPSLVTGAMIDACAWNGDKPGQDRYQVKWEFELRQAANRYLAGTQDFPQIVPALGRTRVGRRITRREFAALALAWDLGDHFGRLT